MEKLGFTVFQVALEQLVYLKRY
ncbi:hypothetical protein N1689_03890 [Pantoea sp. XY16]|nr:hypothetical protein [Pantoea sp. XY16]MCT2416983.1 hypothetical protein [Pantoea sp. XY16]